MFIDFTDTLVLSLTIIVINDSWIKSGWLVNPRISLQGSLR